MEPGNRRCSVRPKNIHFHKYHQLILMRLVLCLKTTAKYSDRENKVEKLHHFKKSNSFALSDYLKNKLQDLPVGPVAKTTCSQCRGCGVNSRSGNWIPTCCNWVHMPQRYSTCHNYIRAGTAKNKYINHKGYSNNLRWEAITIWPADLIYG